MIQYKLLVPLSLSPFFRMPDGNFEFCDRVKNSLQYDILLMLKSSCESAMHNHLLMRDLRVGKFDDAVDGVESIRNVYRQLQERISSGEEVFLGKNSENFKLYLATAAGLTIESAASLLSDCESFDDGNWAEYSEAQALEKEDSLIFLKTPASEESVEVESETSSIDISLFHGLDKDEEESFNAIEGILTQISVHSSESKMELEMKSMRPSQTQNPTQCQIPAYLDLDEHEE